jgi:hypothetical protein
MRMDETNGTDDPQDISGYSNHGTKEGNSSQTDNGFYGKGFLLNGEDDRINLSRDTFLSEYYNYTISLWFNFSEYSSTYNTLYSEANSTNNNEYISFFVWQGGLYFLQKDIVNIVYLADTSKNYSDGSWHHIVLRRNYKDFELFDNGVSVFTDSSANPIEIENINNCYIGGGRFNNGDYYFNGTIDEVLMFNRSLSLLEIKSLYNSSVNQYNNNFTGLSDGEYNFTGYAVDRAGNKNETEKRNVFIDSQKPNISFIDPTLSNDTHINDTYVNVNISSSDENQHYTFLDFNESLQLWMRMDEASNSGEGSTVYDESTHLNDGIAFANANQTDIGAYGKGFYFDGQNDCINLGSESIIANCSNYTISVWFNTTSVRSGSDSIYYEYQSSISPYLKLWHVPNTGHVWFQHASGGICSMDADIDANNGEWHHVVVTRNGSFFEMFHNGASVTSDNSASVGEMLFFTNSSIGGDMQGTINSFNGTIDEVLLFNRTLSLNEIKSVYNSTVNQYDANMTGLIDKSYNYTGYAIDSAGSINKTEKRVVTVDTINPAVAFNFV